MFKNSLNMYALLAKQTKNVIPASFASFQIRLTSSEAKANENWEKIYYGPLTPQIRAVKVVMSSERIHLRSRHVMFQFFSLSSSVLGIAAQPVLYREITALDSVPLAVAAYSFVGFFTVATPILLHLITKKYVSTLEYDKANDVYLARTYNFFCIPKEVGDKWETVYFLTILFVAAF